MEPRKELNLYIISEFLQKNTKYTHTKYGHEIKCKKGLFGVTAPTYEQAMSEAWRYFIQYYNDGEYD